jgi:hypothetical protein
MNDVDLIVTITAIILMAIIVYTIGSNTGSGSPDQQHFLNMPPPVNEGGIAASPLYGEAHPINAYDELLHKTGTYNIRSSGGTTTEDARNSLLYSQGVFNKNEDEQHRIYYQSNVGKYPMQIIGDITELKTTRSPYIGFTRAMRGISIGATESTVPDKIERTMRPLLI